MTNDGHGKLCGYCKKWVRAGKVAHHIIKCQRKYEKKNGFKD